MYHFHTHVITYRLCTRHRSRGDSEDAHHNLYLTAHLVQESRLPGLVSTIVIPAGLPKWTQTMCAWCESRSRLSRSLTWLPGHNTYQKSKLLRHLDIEGGELVSWEGSVSPMCGCTLFLGSPHKNSGVRQCSTRQPTVYSYTASHRSPCIRVDSPTQFHLHLQHDHYHPDSQLSNIIIFIVATRHAYKQ